MRFIVLLNMVFSILCAQKHVDMLIQDVLSGARDSAAYYLPMLEKQYPNNPNMLFLKGLMESDGEEAMQIFVKLYNNHPTSAYGDDAVMKVAEFYYASGLYVQSANWLKKMPLYYHRSEHIERAVKLFLNSLIVSGLRDTAIHYSKVFKKQFPSFDIDGKINDLLEGYGNSKQPINSDKLITERNPEVYKSPKSILSKNAEEDKISFQYSLQSGAFSLKENAENQKIYLMSGGFQAHISELYHQTKKLYVVRIGNYNNSKEAEEVRKKIKSLLDLDTIVVNNK